MFVPLLVVRLYDPEFSFFYLFVFAVYYRPAELIYSNDVCTKHNIIYTRVCVRFEKLYVHVCLCCVYTFTQMQFCLYKLYRVLYTFNVIRFSAKAFIIITRAEFYCCQIVFGENYFVFLQQEYDTILCLYVICNHVAQLMTCSRVLRHCL